MKSEKKATLPGLTGGATPGDNIWRYLTPTESNLPLTTQTPSAKVASGRRGKVLSELCLMGSLLSWKYAIPWILKVNKAPGIINVN